MTTTEISYWIPEQNLPALNAKLEKINRKAAKLGAFAISWKQTGKVEMVEVATGGQDALGKPLMRKVLKAEVVVAGDAPTLNGWTFIATLEHANELGNVLRVVPGYEKDLPAEYRTATPENCDHCHTRRQRNDTYVLSHENGRFAQVGSTCLKDFFGHNNPHGYARFCEYLMQVGEACQNEQGFGSGSSEYVDDLVEFLAYCAAQVRRNGFVTRKAERAAAEAGVYGVRSTASAALSALHPSTLSKIEEWERPTTEDTQFAETVANWCMALKDRDPASLNDFMHNLKVATGTGYVGAKKAGIAAAAIGAYRRENEPKDDFSKSRYVGKEGEKIEGVAKLLKKMEINTRFGVSYMHKFLTDGGNVAIWWASNPGTMLEGQSYAIRGTVKKHETREGVAQTTLSRVTQPKGKK